VKASASVLTSTAVICLISLASPGAASAVTQSRIFQANSTALCQSAMPVFDGLIRKRPLAVQNEGSSDAFVTCSFLEQGIKAITAAQVWASSHDGAAHTLTCVGITGFNGGPNEYVAENVTLAATGEPGYLFWEAAQFAGSASTFPSSYFSVSCKLPPGVSLNQLQLNFTEDVGA
jgi:hypothetical protein